MGLDFQLNFSGMNVAIPEPDANIRYDLLIVGGGPAGLNAAIYAKRKGLEVGILTKQIGGQVMNTSSVENYLGTVTASGEGLVDNFKAHIQELQIPVAEYVEVESIIPGEITDGSEVVKDRPMVDHRVILTDGRIFNTRTLLLATGTNHRKLGVEGEERLNGRGVAYCAICDAPLYRNKNVIIAGGGNSAVEAAIDLSKIAKHVTVVHRSQFRADKILVDEIGKISNVDIYLESQILSIEGEEVFSHIRVLDKKTDQEFELSADGIFVEIGIVPNNELFREFIELNSLGEVVVDSRKRTNIPGIYAAGDVTDVEYKQIIIATSDGAVAALAANDFINLQKAKERIYEYENVK